VIPDIRQLLGDQVKWVGPPFVVFFGRPAQSYQAFPPAPLGGFALLFPNAFVVEPAEEGGEPCDSDVSFAG